MVYIEQGSDSDEIVDELQTQGVIESPLLFRVALLVEGARSRTEGGRISVQTGRLGSGRDRPHRLGQGDPACDHHSRGPDQRGRSSSACAQDDLLAGDIHEVPREGALLPETYKFHRGDRRDKLLQKMERDQKQLVDSLWRSRAPTCR